MVHRTRANRGRTKGRSRRGADNPATAAAQAFQEGAAQGGSTYRRDHQHAGTGNLAGQDSRRGINSGGRHPTELRTYDAASEKRPAAQAQRSAFAMEDAATLLNLP